MASPDDDLGYLSPSFDPSSLTMPRLRNILMTHEIGYPASAKKPQLIDLFVQELKPKARKIMAVRDRVRRTSRGITDMPSSQEGAADGNLSDHAGSTPPPPTPKERRPRKSARVSAESDTLKAKANAPTSRGKSGSNKNARLSDTETNPDLQPKRQSIARSRKSEVTPQINIEKEGDLPVRPPLKNGVFSNENPFQSGSSPSDPDECRRRSAGFSNDRRRNTGHRRKDEVTGSTSALQSNHITPPSSKTFEVPLSRLERRTINDEPDGVDVGEEFTPEEQLELEQECAVQGKRDILPSRQKGRSFDKAGSAPKSAPLVILLALLSGYAIWWRQQKLAVGYCGIGRPSNSISHVNMPHWAGVLQPSCEPCPQHAICYEDMETRCEDNFILQPHPLTSGGLIPLPPTCEPDGEKARKVKAVADKAIEELRARKAKAECGVLGDDTGKIVSEEIAEQQLKMEVAKKRRRGMGDAEFDELWKGALGEVTGREEVTVSTNG